MKSKALPVLKKKISQYDFSSVRTDFLRGRRPSIKMARQAGGGARRARPRSERTFDASRSAEQMGLEPVRRYKCNFYNKNYILKWDEWDSIKKLYLFITSNRI